MPDPNRPIYFEVVAKRAKRGAVVGDRSLALQGARNARDLGGYGTIDGYQVRWGRLFRADGLDALTNDDRARLAALGLPSTCPDDTTTAGSAAAPLDATTIRAAAEANIADPDIRARHGVLLRSLARGDLPQFVSCSRLDDRTGWPVALVLTTLGVGKETIVADYLQTNLTGATPPVDRAYLEAGYEAVRKKYKTFGRYLARGLGLNERTYMQLRDRLVD